MVTYLMISVYKTDMLPYERRLRLGQGKRFTIREPHTDKRGSVTTDFYVLEINGQERYVEVRQLMPHSDFGRHPLKDTLLSVIGYDPEYGIKDGCLTGTVTLTPIPAEDVQALRAKLDERLQKTNNRFGWASVEILTEQDLGTNLFYLENMVR